MVGGGRGGRARRQGGRAQRLIYHKEPCSFDPYCIYCLQIITKKKGVRGGVAAGAACRFLPAAPTLPARCSPGAREGQQGGIRVARHMERRRKPAQGRAEARTRGCGAGSGGSGSQTARRAALAVRGREPLASQRHAVQAGREGGCRRPGRTLPRPDPTGRRRCAGCRRPSRGRSGSRIPPGPGCTACRGRTSRCPAEREGDRYYSRY